MFLCQEPPAEYKGREHAFIKHQVLKSYLDRLLHIIGVAAPKLQCNEVVYVDCFAGPWIEGEQTIATTSIQVGIDQLVKAKRDLGKKAGATFRGLFIEKDPSKFARLQAHLASEQTRTGIILDAINGDFPNCVPEILAKCGRQSFCFFFLDPFGYKTISPKDYEALIKRPKSELLINLMVDNINRAKTWDNEANKSNLQALFGQDIAVTPASELTKLYLSNIVAHARPEGPRPYSALMPILKTNAARSYYELAYLTFNAKGLIEFKSIVEKTLPEQYQVQAGLKAKKKLAVTGQDSLFEPTPSDVKQLPFGATAEFLKHYILGALQNNSGRIVFNREQFARTLCDADTLPKQLQRCFQELIEQGLATNASSSSKRKTHFIDCEKSEVLALCQSTSETLSI
jgi:three-Cys-motif partner protein